MLPFVVYKHIIIPIWGFVKGFLGILVKNFYDIPDLGSERSKYDLCKSLRFSLEKQKVDS